jgi:hypothetical protein
MKKDAAHCKSTTYSVPASRQKNDYSLRPTCLGLR